VAEHFQEPGWFTKSVSNRTVAALTRAGVSIAGSRVLEVQGRKSGEWRRTPVNVLTVDGARGHGRLVLGRRSEPISVTEISDDEKPARLRAYLKRWKW
jgi:hypothetical protein